ncbi:ATP-grasp enzyme-like protein [Desulfocucumis palustris]|uniref:ATP-grasp enzyme-like protein n=1 Tax=Desulfocucumis palustris TaxID=1898651 RepID=A0A2L2XAZ7_9FIRM|nr:ATP-grasp domain-containing protein [Desulfocucumis palustris]GBF33457.1 ATP-grasp enzyme-like protein [Desulfocucumis palustris]
MNNINVLVTGSGSLYGVAVIKSLLKSALKLKLVATDTDPRTLGLHFAHRGYIVPPAFQEGLYYEKILDIIRGEKINAVFVASSHELAFFSGHKEEIEAATGAWVFVNPPGVMNICCDKWLTIKFLKENNFNFPGTIRYPEDRALLEKFIREAGFPVIIKPRRGAGSEDLYKAASPQELLSLVKGREGFVLQQYLPEADGEYTTGICAGADGRVLSAVTLKRILRDGMTMSAEADDYEHLTDYCRQVAGVLKPYGPCNFQFRLLEGRPYIFEINPRFSSSTGMRCLLGINEAEILLRAEILGEAVSPRKAVKGSIIRQYKDYIVPTGRIRQLEKESFCVNRPG